MAQYKTFRLGEFAKLLDLELVGDANCEINGLGTLQNARPGQVSFLSNPSYVDQLGACQASAVIVAEKFAERCPQAALVSAQPYVSYARASALFTEDTDEQGGVHASAVVHESVRLPGSVAIGAQVVIAEGAHIGERCRIGAGCYVGSHVSLGEGCTLHANVTLYRRVELGDRVTVHSGCVIGADGFGYAFDGRESIKIEQLGTVRIGDDVEIGAGTTIDRGAIEDTVIEQGVKIDNQVQIGHNCIVGAHSILCGCVALAGSVRLGRHCVLGGASGVVGHVSLAEGVQVSAMSLVSRSIAEPGTYSSGTGVMDSALWKRNIVRFRQLDEIAQRLKKLEKVTDTK